MQSTFIIPLAYLYITATFAVFFLPLDVLIDLTREDHYFENSGAVSCFVAAIFFFLRHAEACFFRPKHRIIAWQFDKKGQRLRENKIPKKYFLLFRAPDF